MTPAIGTKYRMAMGELIEFKGIIDGFAVFHLLESMCGTDIRDQRLAIKGDPNNISGFINGERAKEVKA